jgi:hypothetical protein
VKRRYVYLSAIVLVLVLVALVYSTPKVSGSSTINQTYEETFYAMISRDVIEVFRYRIDVSIQTEPEGTWRNNSRYNIQIVTTLIWYNKEFLPTGITVECSPYIPSTNINCTTSAYHVNITSEDIYPWSTWTATFQTGSLYSGEKRIIEITPIVNFYVYNGTMYIHDFRGLGWWAAYLTHTFHGPVTYLYLQTEEPKSASQSEMENLIARIDDLNKSLALTNNLVLILLALVVIAIAINVVVQVRKTNEQRQVLHGSGK